MQIHLVQYKIQFLNNKKNGKMENYTSMENQPNVFFWTFSSFCFYFIGSNAMVFVAQINVSNKSYGCVDGIHAN